MLKSSQVKPHIEVNWVTFFLDHMGHWVKSNMNSDSPAIFLKTVTMDSEYLSTSDCHGSGRNSVLHACF